MRLVVDASVAVEYPLRTALGRSIAERIERDDLLAPALLDAEVLAAVRRAWLAKKLSDARAAQALDDLVAWNVRRIPLAILVAEARGVSGGTRAATTPSTWPPRGSETHRSSPRTARSPELRRRAW